MRIRRATALEAKRQAAWLVTIDPWRALGYGAAPLSRWLGARARMGQCWVATEKGTILGLIVAQPEVLLGDFIAILAVHPDHAGRGLGRSLVQHAARRTQKKRRFLYTSSSSDNPHAGRFYKYLGFVRVGRLPDLVKVGVTEILWRRDLRRDP